MLLLNLYVGNTKGTAAYIGGSLIWHEQGSSEEPATEAPAGNIGNLRTSTLSAGVYPVDKDYYVFPLGNTVISNPLGIAVVYNGLSFIMAYERATDLAWSTVNTYVGVDRSYENGDTKTATIVRVLGSEAQAAYYCVNYQFADGRPGYLPTMAELLAIPKYFNNLNTALTQCGATWQFEYHSVWWSSDERDTTYACRLAFPEQGSCNDNNSGKYEHDADFFYVLPCLRFPDSSGETGGEIGGETGYSDGAYILKKDGSLVGARVSISPDECVAPCVIANNHAFIIGQVQSGLLWCSSEAVFVNGVGSASTTDEACADYSAVASSQALYDYYGADSPAASYAENYLFKEGVYGSMASMGYLNDIKSYASDVFAAYETVYGISFDGGWFMSSTQGDEASNSEKYWTIRLGYASRIELAAVKNQHTNRVLPIAEIEMPE